MFNSSESNILLKQRTDNQITDKSLQEEDDHDDDENITTADVKVQFTDSEPRVGKLTTESDTKTRRRTSENIKKVKKKM